MMFVVLLLLALQGETQPAVGEKPLVLFFVRTDCPISNRYAPEIEHLYKRFHGEGMDLRLVYVERELTTAQIEAHRREYRYTIPGVTDPDRRYVQMAHATTTPEAAVFVQGKLVYRGRIDDRYIAFGKSRPQAMRHDVEEVLEAIAAGKAVSPRDTKAVGCAIGDLQ